MVGLRSTVLAVVALLSLAVSNATSAVEKTTRWYTIDIEPPDAATPPLFLTSTGQGIKLERYRSGDPTQHWTYVHLYYPTAPPVVGTWPGEDFVQCRAGCPFQGHGEGLRKYVNRASGACLGFQQTNGQAVVVPCSSQDAEIAKQVWFWEFGDTSVGLYGPPRDYTNLMAVYQQQGRCLEASPPTTPLVAGTGLHAAECRPVGSTASWYQRYRFLEAASITCKRDFDWQLCFTQ